MTKKDDTSRGTSDSPSWVIPDDEPTLVSALQDAIIGAVMVDPTDGPADANVSHDPIPESVAHALPPGTRPRDVLGYDSATNTVFLKYDPGNAHSRGYVSRGGGRSGRTGSKVLKTGPLEGTLLTIIGPGYKNYFGIMTWKTVLCACACGNRIELPYNYVYRRPAQYSCGCTNRRNVKGLEKRLISGDETAGSVLDVTGTILGHANGTVLFVLNQLWPVLTLCCYSCGHLSEVRWDRPYPAHDAGTIFRWLMLIAMDPCPKCGK